MSMSQPLGELTQAQRAVFIRLLEERRASDEKTQKSISRSSSRDHFPLSFGQERLWFLDRVQESAAAYQMLSATRLEGDLDGDALGAALEHIVERHEILRTVFPSIDGEPVQLVSEHGQVKLDREDFQHRSPSDLEDAISEQVRERFDLGQGPLLRARLLHTAEREHVLVLTMHHIVSDDWSMGVLLREMALGYQAAVEKRDWPLKPLRVQYGDFATWQREHLQGERLAAQLQYWRKQLDGIEALQLPWERARPAVQSYCGGRLRVQLSGDLVRGLHALAQREGATLYMALLAAWQILLARYSNQEDIAVGSPVANRKPVEVEDLIGFFVNTLVLRTDLRGDPAFCEVLRRVKRVCLEAYEHQEAPFERVVEELRPERTLSYTPLFQVMLSLQNTPRTQPAMGSLRLSPVRIESEAAPFDLLLSLTGKPGGGLQGMLNYSSDVFSRSAMERLLTHWTKLLEGLVREPDRSIWQVPLLDESERQQVRGYSAEAQRPTDERSWLEQFEAVVHRNPDAPAIAGRYSYRELNEASNQVANWLHAQAVAPEQIVAVAIERSPELIAAWIGVWKAGAAVLPLDPSWPSERLASIVKQAQPTALFASREGRLPSNLPQLDIYNTETLQAYSTQHTSTPLTQTQLAYLLFTSGSTGLLQCPHFVLTARIERLKKQIKLECGDVVSTNPDFNNLSWPASILWPLVSEAQLDLDECASPHAVKVFGPRILITDEWGVAQIAANANLSAIRQVLCYAPELPAKLVQRFQACSAARLSICFGWPQCGEIAFAEARRNAPSDESKPLRVQVYEDSLLAIRGKNLWGSEVPPGVEGELFIISRDQAIATGDHGKLWLNRILELTKFKANTVFWKGARINLNELSAALETDERVDAATVLMRHDCDDQPHLVAYIVPAPRMYEDPSLSVAFSWEVSLACGIHDQLRSSGYASALPSKMVLVEALPRTPQGTLNNPALESLFVAEQALQTELESSLHPTIREAGLTMHWATLPSLPTRLHVFDLFPDNHPAQPISISRPPQLQSELTPAASNTVIHGGTLAPPPDCSRTLTEILIRAASGQAQITYVQENREHSIETCAELLHRAERILAGLRNVGLQPGQIVLAHVANDRELLGAFWSCILGGFLPVLASATEDTPQMTRFLDQWEALDRPFIITSYNSVSTLRSSLRSHHPEGEPPIGVIENLAKHAPGQPHHPAKPDDPAYLNFTSGTTGTPKAAILTHRGLVSRAQGANQLCGFHTPHTILSWLPLHHSGSLCDWHLRPMELGCSEIYVAWQDIAADPRVWLDMIDRYKAYASWAPNFVFHLVASAIRDRGARPWDLSSLHYLLTASESISRRAVDEFAEALAPFGLQRGSIRPAYGMTELGSGVTYVPPDDGEIRFHTIDRTHLSGTILRTSAGNPNSLDFADLGFAIPGVSMRVVAEDGVVLPEETIGRLQIRGAPLLKGYYKSPALDPMMWFDTGDLAFFVDQRLVLTGREKDIVIANGMNFYCHELEAVAEEVEGVVPSYTAICQVHDCSTDAERIALFFVISNPAQLAQVVKRIRGALAAQKGLVPDYILSVDPGQIPKTATGKIKRAELGRSFDASIFNPAIRDLDLREANERTLPSWFYKMVWEPEQLAEHPPSSECISVLPGSHLLADKFWETVRQQNLGPQFVRSAQPSPNLDLPSRIVFFTSGDADADVHSVLLLIEELEQRLLAAPSPIRLLIVTAGAVNAAPADTCNYRYGGLQGFVENTRRRFPQLDCRTLDLEPSDPGHGAHIITELNDPSRVVSDIAYRSGTRLKRYIQPVDWSRKQHVGVTLAHGNLYLLVGNPAPESAALARWFMKEQRAKLILASNDLESETGEAWSRHLDLLRKYDNDLIFTCNTSDLVRLRAAILDAVTRFGVPLAGIIHLQPEIDSAAAAFQLLSEVSETGFFAAFSTLSSNGTTSSAIADGAFQSFMDSLGRNARRAVYHLRWSSWIERSILNSSADNRPFVPMIVREAMISLRAALAHSPGEWLIGLNPENRHIYRRVHPSCVILRRLSLSFRNSVPLEDLPPSEQILTDAFGTTIACHVALEGAADDRTSKAAESLSAGYPSGELAKIEQELVNIWQSVLQKNFIQTHDNFFDLGGTSLLIIRLIDVINATLGYRLAVVDIFRSPTIRALAQRVTETEVHSPAPIPDRKALAKRQRERRSHKFGVDKSAGPEIQE